MLRRYGLLAGMFFAAMLLVGEAAAQKVSVFTRKKPDLKHTYGVQLLGGISQYWMGDINDYVSWESGRDTLDSEAFLGLEWGIALLYRSNENLRFLFGFNTLGHDTSYVEWYVQGNDIPNESEMIVSGSELYLQMNYKFRYFGQNLHLLAGPSIVNGYADYSPASGTAFSDARGRALGFRTGLGGEWMIGENWSIAADLGYRFARVTEISWDDRSGNKQIVYYGGGNRRLEVDFSGIFVEIGARLYFEPATDWVRF